MSKQIKIDKNKKYRINQWSINSAERKKDACHPGRRRASRVFNKYNKIYVF